MINIIGQNNSAETLRYIAEAFPTEKEITICWGAREVKSTGISLNCVKRKDAKEQLTLIANAGLNVPVWTEDLEQAKTWVRQGDLIWGRNWIHSRGTDIIGPGYRHVKTKSRKLVEIWNNHWLKREWWVKVIPNNLIKEEWRLHIFQGRCLGRALKVQTAAPVRVQPVRNRDNGWTMVHSVEPLATLRNAAATAVKAVGYNFGAVDLFLLHDNSIVVLEVNSAPAIRSEYTRSCYQTALSRIAESNWLVWRDKDFTDVR